MTKHFLRIAMLTCSVLLLTACLPPKTPQEVTQAFWEAVLNDDVEHAVEYSTLASAGDYDGFGMNWKGYQPTWGRVVIEGDEASIVSEFAGPANSEMEDKKFVTYLVRRNEKWLVDYDRTNEQLHGGVLGKLFGSLGRLGDNLTKEFQSSASDFQREMERMSKELEGLSQEFSRQAEKSIDQYAEELRRSLKELEESINRALKDKGSELSDRDRRVLKEVAADLEVDRKRLENPTIQDLAASSVSIGTAQLQLESVQNKELTEYKKRWRELGDEFEKSMKGMLDDLSAPREDKGIQI